jgi:hypothetical protein
MAKHVLEEAISSSIRVIALYCSKDREKNHEHLCDDSWTAERGLYPVIPEENVGCVVSMLAACSYCTNEITIIKYRITVEVRRDEQNAQKVAISQNLLCFAGSMILVYSTDAFRPAVVRL